ncbi:hypothetical protein FRB94_006232 [Tulasnella sp. JGI-2019a]|nr:hypothetical protein FRB94_006232 [Tulasnella sp. JGI-2019a]
MIPFTIEMWIREGYRRAGKTDKDITHAQSALWIMETAQDHEHLLVVAKNVTSLDKGEAIWILRESQEFPKLLYGLHASLIKLQQAHEHEVRAKTVQRTNSTPAVQAIEQDGPDRQDDGNSVGTLLDTALSFARAVTHIIFADTDPQCWLKEVREALVDPMDLKWEEPGWLRSKDLMILCSFILRQSRDGAQHIRDSPLPLYKERFETDHLSQFTVITFIRHCIISRRLPEIIQYADSRIAGDEEYDSELEWAIHILDLGQPELSDTLLSMISLAMISTLRSPDGPCRWPTRRWRIKELAQCAWLTCSGIFEDVLDNVLDALSAYHKYFESVMMGT